MLLPILRTKNPVYNSVIMFGSESKAILFGFY